jgi:hypothetical protein
VRADRECELEPRQGEGVEGVHELTSQAAFGPFEGHCGRRVKSRACFAGPTATLWRATVRRRSPLPWQPPGPHPPADAVEERPMTASRHPAGAVATPEVTGFFHEATNTISYVVRDPGSDCCAVIDPVTDLDYAAGRIAHGSADAIIDHIATRGLRLEWLIETHVHADHLSAAPYIQDRLGGRIGIGEKITVVQEIFGDVSTKGPTSVATAASSTGCSGMATPTPSVGSRPARCTRPAIRRRA